MEFMTWKEIGVLAVNQLGSLIMCLISSLIFVYLLLTILSPKLKISSEISKQTFSGTDYWIFKIINKSRFSAYNVKFRLVQRIPYIVDGTKVNHRLVEIPLVKQEVFSIPGYRKGESKGDYAALIATSRDLSQDIGVNHLEYQLSISMAHGLSNLTKVFKKSFKNSTCIHNNPFVFGNSLKIRN